METDLVPQDDAPMARVDFSIENIVASAIQSGRSPEELREIVAFARELRAEKSLAAYNEAMALFRRTCPKIVKRTDNSQFTVTRNGIKRPSRFASMADISEAIDGPLGAAGLTYRFTDADTSTEPGKMKVGAIISHAAGHVANPVYVEMPLDTGGAGSSPQQKVGSVMQYAMRYALTAALGLVGCDDDDVDGNESDAEKITDEQYRTIVTLAAEVGADVDRFKAYLGVQDVKDLPASKYQAAIKALESKRGK